MISSSLSLVPIYARLRDSLTVGELNGILVDLLLALAATVFDVS